MVKYLFDLENMKVRFFQDVPYISLGSLTVRTMLLHGVDGSSILQRGTKLNARLVQRKV